MDYIDIFYVFMVIIVGGLVGVLVFGLGALVLLLLISMQIIPTSFLLVVIWLREWMVLVGAAFVGSIMFLLFFIPYPIPLRWKKEDKV